MDSSFIFHFFYPIFILFLSSFSTYFLHLLHYFTRFSCNHCSAKGVALNDLNKIELMQTMEQKQDFIQEKSDFLKFSCEKNDEKETPFTFKFPTFEEFCKKHKDSQLENSQVDTTSNDGFELDDYKVVSFQKGSDFHDQGCVFELQSLNENNIGEVEEENEEIDAFSEDNLHKLHVESVYLSADMNSNSGGLTEKKITQVDEKEEIHNESVDISADLNVDSNDTDNPISPKTDLQPEDGFLSDGDFELEFDEKEGTWTKSNFLSEKDFVTKSRNISEPEVTNQNEVGKENNSSNDTTNKLESLWEHQELIEQLKMEIKKVRAIGLPTIFEESESPPKIMDELKPWKIEEVYHNGGGDMSEVHKFYKSYRERMRKFDIFNYQKMYAIGFLQLKDPFWSSSSSKSSVPEFATLLNQSFTTNKGKKSEDDPTMKFIKELQSDLEVVYVGQMCMSWEILHWQYEKALDIWESDPRGVRRFNEIAGEFQQFQVLMQRFIEDEPFQGPRIQHYVKSRCVFRNLLQVPAIRADDYVKNRKVRSEEVVYDITSDVLVEILEESIRIFWRFVRADKYKRQTPAQFQKPEDLQFFIDLQKDLHKKEKKLKEQLRSGNCILKKFRSCREDDEIDDPVLYFFCQVDMKLVSRVLQMTRITSDQLIWCHNKLSKVSFVKRKIHVEPSFLLFPC